MNKPPPRLSVPVALRRGALRGNEWASVESGRVLFAHSLEISGWPTFADKKVLDIGCGVKIAQAILEYDLTIEKYHGLDINEELIDILSRELDDDDRFQFTFSNFHNELYNPLGELITSETRLPVEPNHYDMAWAFSVFTHLNPEDSAHMLRMVSESLVEGGLFFFSAFIDPLATEPFVDAVADQPLKWAYFSESAFVDMILDSGLEILRYREPEEHIQHQFLCRRISTPSKDVPDLEKTDFMRERFSKKALEDYPDFLAAIEKRLSENR